MAQGARDQVAAAEVGISGRSLVTWKSRGRLKCEELGIDDDSDLDAFGLDDEDKLYVKLFLTITRARLVGEGHMFDQVKQGDKSGLSFGPAKANLELLSRLNRHYSPKIQLGVEKELDKILDIAQEVLSTEDYNRLVYAIAARDENDEDDN